jgi:hypothetical protein
MNKFEKALGKKFVENKDIVRIRTFELGGHTFRVKVPLTVESDAMSERLKLIDDAEIEQCYVNLTKDIEVMRKELKDTDGIEFLENDIVVAGRSMRETAKMKVTTDKKITEMIRLLVPEEKDFDMSTIEYKDIEEIFPLPIQMALVEAITDTISFDYGKTKEK